MKTLPTLAGAAAAAAALLVLAGPAAGQQPPSPPAAGQPAAVEIGKARALIKQRRYVEALTVLGPLAKRRPVPANALFLIGLAGIEASQQKGTSAKAREALLDASIAALRTMLVRNPGLVRVRLELGRAFFLKGEDGLAREHFERVLAGNPPAAVALNVNHFLNRIRARKRWSLRIGMAVAPDSNVSASSDEERILIDTPFGRLPFTVQENKPRSGIGLSVWAGGEYQYPIEDRWRLRAGADISRREYRSDEFDRMVVSAHLGPRWLIDRTSEASVLASIRQSWLADEEDWRDLGLRVEGRHRLNRQTTAFLNASRHERRYDANTHLDGPIADLSAGLGWVAAPTMRIDTALGWGQQRTERERHRNSYRWGRLGATFLLPWGFTLGGAGTLRWTDYEGNWAPFVLGGGERRDLTRSIRLNVHNRAFTVGGFSPQLSMVKEERTSNAQLHDYERISGELRFVRLF